MSHIPGLQCIFRNGQVQVLRDTSNVAMFLILGLAVVCFVGAAWAFTDAAPEPYMVSETWVQLLNRFVMLWW